MWVAAGGVAVAVADAVAAAITVAVAAAVSVAVPVSVCFILLLLIGPPVSHQAPTSRAPVFHFALPYPISHPIIIIISYPS